MHTPHCHSSESARRGGARAAGGGAGRASRGDTALRPPPPAGLPHNSPPHISTQGRGHRTRCPPQPCMCASQVQGLPHLLGPSAERARSPTLLRLCPDLLLLPPAQAMYSEGRDTTLAHPLGQIWRCRFMSWFMSTSGYIWAGPSAPFGSSWRSVAPVPCVFFVLTAVSRRFVSRLASPSLDRPNPLLATFHATRACSRRSCLE